MCSSFDFNKLSDHNFPSVGNRVSVTFHNDDEISFKEGLLTEIDTEFEFIRVGAYKIYYENIIDLKIL